MKSAYLQAMMTLIESHTDPEESTVEDWHPMTFAAKANAEDNPNWNEAMNWPDKAGYWEACKKEIYTLLGKEAWDKVEQQD
jgi:hypothetical protein